MREGLCESSFTKPDLTETLFLAVAVVNSEVLRAQEEWDVVDTIHPDPGKCGNGSVQRNSQQNPHARPLLL